MKLLDVNGVKAIINIRFLLSYQPDHIVIQLTYKSRGNWDESGRMGCVYS
jgi:hypothetical protein